MVNRYKQHSAKRIGAIDNPQRNPAFLGDAPKRKRGASICLSRKYKFPDFFKFCGASPVSGVKIAVSIVSRQRKRNKRTLVQEKPFNFAVVTGIINVFVQNVGLLYEKKKRLAPWSQANSQ
jgi:hypothetical protein